MKLQTTCIALNLNSSIIVSACTLSEQIDNIVRMEDNGEGGVVLFSLFEEPISKEEARLKNIVSTTTNSFAEATDYFPDLEDFSVGTNEYLEYIRKAKQLVKFPIIGSLNGITIEGWID